MLRSLVKDGWSGLASHFPLAVPREREGEDEQEEVVSQPKIQPVNANIKSKFPLKTQREIDDHAKSSKKAMQAGGDAFMKKYEEYQIAKKSPKKEEKPKV